MVFAPLKSSKPETGFSIDYFVGQFRGDRDHYGYAHENLALAVCERFGPGSPRELVERFYPECKGKGLELDSEIEKIICAGYTKWIRLNKPRVGRTGRSER